jgi:hypothetical protein
MAMEIKVVAENLPGWKDDVDMARNKTHRYQMQFHINLPKGTETFFQKRHYISREPVTCAKLILYYYFWLHVCVCVCVYMYVCARTLL